MRIVIMADGKGTRWDGYMGVPKHLVEVQGEPIIARTVRLLREHDDNNEIIITSHDPRYEFEGAHRHEPENNILELDRFTAELIEDDMSFLYGDTIYTEESIKQILEPQAESLVFYGNSKSIVGIRVQSAKAMREHIARVRESYLSGQITKCKGWQVYASYTDQLASDALDKSKSFVAIDEYITDINTPKEYEALRHDESS